LATIGQDYFDIDLFAYQGAFPLVDAYRVELGVDAGAGPRRLTLFFIPPRTKLHDYPEMAARLCAGARRRRPSAADGRCGWVGDTSGHRIFRWSRRCDGRRRTLRAAAREIQATHARGQGFRRAGQPVRRVNKGFAGAAERLC